MYEYFLNKKDTIISISTPLIKSSIGIIKISGLLSEYISKKFFKKKLIPNYAKYSFFYDPNNNTIIDSGILIYFKKPYSYTGEDILEFHGHGNPIILNYILKTIIKYTKNVRLSYPGEYSYRAYLNDKMNITQASTISELINTESIYVYKTFLKSINENNLFKKINSIIKKLKKIKILIETYINFSENYKTDIFLKNKIYKYKNEIILNLEELNKNFKKSNLIKNGIKISLIGNPNVGKSTIFNLLINKEKSIVSPFSGTTRDSIEYIIKIKNFNFIITDTAGIKKTEDILENLSIKKTLEEILKTDFIIYITDILINKKTDIKKLISNILKNLYFENNKKIDNLLKIPFCIVQNKIDIYKKKSEILNIGKNKIIKISAINNDGINLIKKILINKLTNNYNLNINLKYYINNRNYECILKSIKKIIDIDNNDMIIFSNNITDIINILEKIINITNENKNINNNDILNDIFSKFCIGK